MKNFLDFKKWVKSIQSSGYNGAHTVYITGAFFGTGAMGALAPKIFGHQKVGKSIQTANYNGTRTIYEKLLSSISNERK